MAAPSFITSSDTSSWAHAFGSAQNVSLTTQVGDLIVAVASLKSNQDTMAVTSSPALTWTQQALIGPDTSHAEVYIFTTTATAAGSLTVTFTRSGTEGIVWGGTAYQFRAHGGLGAVVTGSGTGSAPSTNITTTGANSSVIMLVGDRAATSLTTQTYRANAGTFTQRTATVATNNDTLAAEYTLYHGYHADAGSTGTYALGMTAPASQTWTLAAIEILGGGGGGGGSAMANRHPIAGVI